MTQNIIHTSWEQGVLNISHDSIDLTVFSPPYDGVRKYEGYPDLDLKGLGKSLLSKTKEGGVCCIVIQDGTKNFRKSGTTFRLTVDWMDLGWNLFETVIYQRHGAPGAWWNQRFRVDHEYVLIFFKGKRPKVFNKKHLMIPAKHAGSTWHGTKRLTDGTTQKINPRVQSSTKCRGTVWPYGTSNQEGNKLKLKHPATMPDKLAEDLILCFSNQGDLILDPMCGSGTTLVMAQKNERDYVGFDISKEYVEISRQRLEIEK